MIFHNIFKNAGIIASGSMGASILNLISFAFVARALSPDLFGVFALAQAFSMIIDKLVNFQSWQALIKYGTDLLRVDNKPVLTKLLQFGFLLDFGTAVLASVLGFILPYFIGGLLDWSTSKSLFASFFSLMILFNIEGTPTAIFRMFDKFYFFAKKDLLIGVTKLLLVTVGFVFSLGIWYFIVAFMVSFIIGYLYFTVSSLRFLSRQNIDIRDNWSQFRMADISKTFPGIWKFVWTTNLHGTVRMTTLRLDILIVDTVLGSTATALYQVTKQFSRLFTQVSQPLYKSIYPEFVRLWVKEELTVFRKLLTRFTVMAFGFSFITWCGFFFLGEFALVNILGPDYSDSYEVTYWYMLGVALSVTAFPIVPAILAIGRPDIPFKVQLYSTIGYFIVLIPLMNNFGLLGAGVSYLCFYVFWVLIMIYFYLTKIKQTLPLRR